MSDTATVFGGLRVLDRSTRLAGAFCARLFGDWGAEVVLAEPPAGHPLRDEPPFLHDRPGPGRSLLHTDANAGKRVISLPPDDPAAAEPWLRWADLIITTEVGPPLNAGDQTIHISITPYGRTGPLAGDPGNDLTAYALSGWAALNGDPDAPPLKGSRHQAGYLAGLAAFVAGCAAMVERDRSGLGQLIDVSELETLTVTAGPAILVASYAGAVTPRHAPDIVRGPVPCADGYFALTISRHQFWRDAMNALGLHDLANDARYAHAGFRRRERGNYSARVEARMAEWRRWELFEALARVRCVAGLVLDTREVVENPHLAARGFFRQAVIAGEARVPFAGAPFKMSHTPATAEMVIIPPPLSVTDRAGDRTNQAIAAAGQRPSDNARANAGAEPNRSGLFSLAGHPARAVKTSGSGAAAVRPHQSAPAALGEANAPDPAGPLAGVRALVLTQAWSGTFATELLGLLGAEVIQIEARSRPDSWRGDYQGEIPAAIRGASRRQRPWNTNGLYNAVNLNKRAITLDLSTPRGIALFRRLVPTADLIAENFTPRVMANLGLDYASLCRIKPDIILASLSAYGATGPYANIPGIGGTIEPMSGMSGLLGYEGGRPQNSGAMYPDPVAGYYFASAMIMALRHRNRTGVGQLIDLGMMEANATMIGDALLEWAANGVIRPPEGNHHPRLAPHNIYRLNGAEAPAWLALAVEDEPAWRALCDCLGRPELVDDPRFATMAARKAYEQEVDRMIADWAVHQEDGATTAALLRSRGITAAPVLDPLGVFASEQLRSREFVVDVAHPEAGRMAQAGVPWRLSRTAARVHRPAPMFGEHGREVLTELLSLSNDEYDALVAAGICGDMPPDG